MSIGDSIKATRLRVLIREYQQFVIFATDKYLESILLSLKLASKCRTIIVT